MGNGSAARRMRSSWLLGHFSSDACGAGVEDKRLMGKLGHTFYMLVSIVEVIVTGVA